MRACDLETQHLGPLTAAMSAHSQAYAVAFSSSAGSSPPPRTQGSPTGGGADPTTHFECARLSELSAARARERTLPIVEPSSPGRSARNHETIEFDSAGVATSAARKSSGRLNRWASQKNLALSSKSNEGSMSMTASSNFSAERFHFHAYYLGRIWYQALVVQFNHGMRPTCGNHERTFRRLASKG